MQHHALSEDLGEHLAIRTQICVIGAGPAGLLAALLLARRGHHVVVVESGPISDADWSSKLNEIDLDPSVTYTGPTTGRQRGLGGTSELWGGRLVPLTAHDLGARDYLGAPAWPLTWDELYAHIPQVEAALGISDPGSYEGALARGKKTTDETDIAMRSPKIVSFRKRNLYAVLADELTRNPNLTIYSDATVTEFGLAGDTGRVTEIHATGPHGHILHVEAEDFVIAAGTLESTRLLLQLDRQSSGNAFAATDALGAHYVDHLAIDVGDIARISPAAAAYYVGHKRHRGTRRAAHFELSPSAQRSGVIGSAYFCLRLDIDNTRLTDLRRQLRSQDKKLLATTETVLTAGTSVAHASLWRLFHANWLQPDFVHLKAEIRIEQTATASNRLGLSDATDPFGVPRARLNWSVGENDLRTIDAAHALYRRFWLDERNRDAFDIDWLAAAEPTRRSPAIRDVYHPSGSTRMGDNPHDSVVDRDLRCHAIPNLRVLSPSVFPTAGSANPMLTLLCLAGRMADDIASHASR